MSGVTVNRNAVIKMDNVRSLRLKGYAEGRTLPFPTIIIMSGASPVTNPKKAAHVPEDQNNHMLLSPFTLEAILANERKKMQANESMMSCKNS